MKYTKNRRLLFVFLYLTVGFWLQGCAHGYQISDEEMKTIQVEVTTEEELVSKFGRPSMVTQRAVSEYNSLPSTCGTPKERIRMLLYSYTEGLSSNKTDMKQFYISSKKVVCHIADEYMTYRKEKTK